MKNSVVFKYSRPSGSETREPSRTMTDALRQLGESDELQALASVAQERGRKIVVQVFHSAEGYPLLIYVGAAANSK